MLVVERWKPVVGFVFLDKDSRARALEERIGVVCSIKVVATKYIMNVLAIAGEWSGVALLKK